MAQLASILFVVLLISGSSGAGGDSEVRAKPGENVPLQCNSPTDAAITKLKWSRLELEKDCVFYFSDNRLSENYQNQSYRGRVELKDPEMKNGDASILLKNVTVNDTGTYQCRVTTNSSNPNVKEFVRSVNLSVSEGPEEHLKNGDANGEQPGGPRGNVGLGVGLGLVCLVVVVVVVVVVGAGLGVKSKRAKKKRSAECFDEEEMSELNP